MQRNAARRSATQRITAQRTTTQRTLFLRRYAPHRNATYRTAAHHNATLFFRSLLENYTAEQSFRMPTPQTEHMVRIVVGLAIGDMITYSELAKAVKLSLSKVKSRMNTVANIALRDHHAILVTERGAGVRRVGQNDAVTVVAKHRNRVRNAAQRGRKTIKFGITDWAALEHATRSQLLVDSAVLGVVAQATDQQTMRRLAGLVDTCNGKIDLGRTLEVLGGK